MLHCIEATVPSLITCGYAHTSCDSYLHISKRYRYVYAHTASGRPLVFIPGRRRKRYANGFLRGELSLATWRGTERNGGGILGGVEAGRISLLCFLPPRDRPRARIIFTEIKSKIRLALKCALDRALARIAGGWASGDSARTQERGGASWGAAARIRRGREDVQKMRNRERQTEVDGGSFGGLNRRNSLLMQIGDS